MPTLRDAAEVLGVVAIVGAAAGLFSGLFIAIPYALVLAVQALFGG